MPRLVMNGSLRLRRAGSSPTTILTDLVCHADSCGLWRSFDHVGEPMASSARVLSSPVEYATAVASGALLEARSGRMARWKVGDVWRMADAFQLIVVPPASGAREDITLDLGMSLELEPALLADESLVDGFRRFWLDLREALGVPVAMGQNCEVKLMGYDYPPPKPPPNRMGWEPGPLFVVDRRAIAESDILRRGRYLDGPLPDWVTRHESDEVVVDVWIPSLADEPDVTRRLSDQEAWLAEWLELPPAPGWNIHGDKLVEHGPLEDARPLLTFYEPASAWGFKATVPIDGKLDEASLADAVAWRRAKALPDGRPLRRLDLIFPTRELVVALRPAAKALGIARTLWVSNDGNLWNIHVPNQVWRTGPSPVEVARAASGVSK